MENQIDHRFDHSWVPNGLDPGPGWYWIPKGNITMETCYPAQQQEIRRFGYLAKKVRRLPSPAPLYHSFSRIVEAGMANREHLRPPKRRQEDWRTEGWMEEDDLLQEDFKQDQDLRRQLQKDPRYLDASVRGRKQEGNYSRALVPSGPDHERIFRGKGFVGGRGESHQGGRVQARNLGQQRGWSQGPNLHGNRNLDSGGRFTGSSGERQPDLNLVQGMSKEGDQGHISNKGNRVPNQDVKCFRCLGTGHFQVDCTNDPVCYKCKEVGHMAMDCKKDEYKKLKMFGFGVPGQGFYTMNFPEAKIKTHENTGLLIILAGEATEERVDRELKNLVREEWDFKVKQIHTHEFLVVFPDKISLETFSKLSEFQMSLYGLKGKIEKTAREYDTSSILHTVWIKIHGVPDLARDVESIKEIAGLVIEPLVVDELSIIKEDPVRVQGRCRNPGAIKGAIEVFFNGSGKLIRFEVEGGKQSSGKGGMGGPPGSNKYDDKPDKDRDKHSKEDHTKKSMSKFDRMGQIDKEMDPNHDDSMEEDLEKVQGNSEVTEGESEQVVATPLAMFCPGVGVMDILQAGRQYNESEARKESRRLNSDLMLEYNAAGNCTDGIHDKNQIVIPGGGVTDNIVENVIEEFDSHSDSKILVHGREGNYLMDKCKWPKLIIPIEKEVQTTEEMEVLTQEESLMSQSLGVNVSVSQNGQMLNTKGGECAEDMMDKESFLDKESDGEHIEWHAPKSRKIKKAKCRRKLVGSLPLGMPTVVVYR